MAFSNKKSNVLFSTIKCFGKIEETLIIGLSGSLQIYKEGKPELGRRHNGGDR